MTWFLKAFVFCATAILVGYVLEVLAGVGSTLWSCKRECKAEPDGNLCSRRWRRARGEPNGEFVPEYMWLRNECERKCFMNGVYERVDMDLCTKDGQNHTTYICNDHKPHKETHERCMRNESLS